MDKRKFLQTAAAGSLLLSYPPAYSQQAHSSSPPQKMSLLGFDQQVGKLIRLEDYAGKVCMVSFFTSGCNLCNNDLKLMREFYVSNKKRDFILLGVNMDDKKSDFQEYMRLIGLSVPKEQSFPIVWRHAPEYVDNFGAIAKKPTHFALDKGHALLFKREGSFHPGDWDLLWTKLG